jgi:hypothetical protein
VDAEQKEDLTDDSAIKQLKSINQEPKTPKKESGTVSSIKIQYISYLSSNTIKGSILNSQP